MDENTLAKGSKWHTIQNSELLEKRYSFHTINIDNSSSSAKFHAEVFALSYEEIL